MQRNVFQIIANEWMLVTAGDITDFNTMTASWGTMGELWHRKVAMCFVRPQRYTYQFMEKSDFFTLSFFDPEYQEALDFCGQNSGRDTDKMKATGLIPFETDSGSVSFEQARLIIECRKIYIDDFKPENFLDRALHDGYPKKDYHRLYIGKIEHCWVQQ